MPRFQSWLFNSIDRSLPVQLGRRARLACQRIVTRIVKPEFALLPAAWEQFSKQVTRVVLYPVYLIAIAAKRSYPQLSADPKAKAPLLLRPFQQIIVWSEHSEIFADARSRSLVPSATEYAPGGSNSMNSMNSISLGKAFPQAIQSDRRHPGKSDQIDQIDQSASKIASNQSEHKLERIRQLIKAAIAYFFGKKPRVPPLETMEVGSQPWLSMDDLFDDDSCHWPAIIQHKLEQQDISAWGSPKLGGINAAQARTINAAPNRTLVKNSARAIIPTTSSNSNSSGLAHESGHSSSEMISDLSYWLEDSFDIELEEPLRPLQAWIETQATFLGYVYSPIMEFVHCLDRLMAKFELWIVQLWQKIMDKLRGDI